MRNRPFKLILLPTFLPILRRMFNFQWCYCRGSAWDVLSTGRGRGLWSQALNGTSTLFSPLFYRCSSPPVFLHFSSQIAADLWYRNSELKLTHRPHRHLLRTFDTERTSGIRLWQIFREQLHSLQPQFLTFNEPGRLSTFTRQRRASQDFTPYD